MKKHLFIILLIPQLLLSQNEGNIWYFGFGAGLDFNSGTAVAINDGQLNTLEGCASIADTNGDLLFYTDGMTVYDKNHSIMANGTGLLGHNSSTQSAIIVKKPQSSTIYYIFTVDGYSGNNGSFCYSEVNLSLNGGLGDITSLKNVELFTNAAEKVTAILHDNGSDFWIVAPQHSTNTYFTYLFSNAGINSTAAQSFSNTVDNDLGYLLATPDGSKIGAVFTINDYVDLFEFDNSTGIISPLLQINGIYAPYGIAFSPNNDIMYVSTNANLFQYDLTAGSNTAILNSELSINNGNYVYDTALQLGPDGKIYYISSTFSQFITTINAPNLLGTACDFDFNSVLLSEGTNTGYGLPTFFSSIFNQFAISSSNYCFGDSTEFSLNTSPDSLFWTFGDPNSGMNNTSTLFTPSHEFTSAGDYTITVTTYLDDFINTEDHIITITSPSVNLGNDTTLCNGASLLLEVTNSNATFVWQDLSTSNTFSTSYEGIYWVEIMEFNCLANDSILIDIIDLELSLGNDTILCFGEELLLDATTDSASYYWQDASSENTLLATANGSYWVGIYQSICSFRDSIHLTINPQITASISGGDSICVGDVFENAQITATGLGPFAIEYTNGIANENLYGEEPFDINIVEEGVYSIVSIVGANNCEGTIFGQVEYVLIQDPTADFYMESNEVFIDNTDITFENYSLNQSFSNWSFGDGYFSQDNAPYISHIYNDVETYHIELIVQNEFGCADTTSQSLIVRPIQYFVPNAFTPNDQNNSNDYFGLVSDKIQSYNMMVFDRWGAMVYESDAIENQWDGTVNGIAGQSGVYTYKMIVEDPLGRRHKLTGSVTLVN